MRLFFAISACLLIATPASAQERDVSWGKIGVDFEQYRQDASDCGHEAWYEDVANTDAARVFKRASRELEGSEYSPDMIRATPSEDEYRRFAIEQATRSARTVEATRPQKRMDEVRTLQYEVLGKCLTEKGYVRFRLTKDQIERLRSIRKGTDARHRYLHSLGSARWVVETQRL